MDTAAILLLESSKPLVWIGGEMGRIFVTPFLPILSDQWGVESEKYITVFENRNNIERLMLRLEEMEKEDKVKVKDKKDKGSGDDSPK